MSNLVKHAEFELKKAGLFDKDSDYDGMLGEAVLELIKVFANQGHSGGSAHMVSELFNKLSRFEPLTPITSDPEEWEDRSEYSPGAEHLWQNRRDSRMLSKDGGKTWWNVEGDRQTPEQQIDKLATFIMENIEGEPSESEGAVDTAIRLLSVK